MAIFGTRKFHFAKERHEYTIELSVKLNNAFCSWPTTLPVIRSASNTN